MAKYLGVGIHEGVVLDSKTGWDDKGNFSIHLAAKVNENDAFEALIGGGTIVEAASVDLKQFALKPTSWDNKPLAAAEIAKDIQVLQMKLQCFMLMYMDAATVKDAFGKNIFNGLIQNPDQYKQLGTLLVNEAFLAGVYRNIVNIFLGKTQPFFETTPFRIKLHRVSKKKHYSSIPEVAQFDRPVDGKWEEPFIELMSVPAEVSKVKWLEWEIKSGKNDGTPLAAAGEGSAAAKESEKAVQQLFATPGTAAATTPVAPEVPSGTQATPVADTAPGIPSATAPVIPAAEPVAPAVAFNQA